MTKLLIIGLMRQDFYHVIRRSYAFMQLCSWIVETRHCLVCTISSNIEFLQSCSHEVMQFCSLDILSGIICR